ncbi:hypothetical protein [Arthrobacter sp. zg-Y1110]|uniref:hypothetical protein n=1 Tax=Arthrobacter sp. zg-Y1110 TaxID=2886932 RepID=UPI001D14825A|nr:hypothetical protein [Arthrobacter sp. zg-Y1110]MCC3291091.1 hypothetical protein [Arthrobacter sp. zg-Y1110]UWX83531.1 hypothetical protein N2K99_08295 [Arthrobacter sp. zg-Y1110]
MKRTLVFDFDTVEQKNTFRSLVSDEALFADPDVAPTPENRVSFPGMLRAADLLSREILLLDVQLLDGAFFLDRGPDAVRTLLARTGSFDQTFSVVARKPSLEESLRFLLLGANPLSPVLAEFEFSSLAMFWKAPRPLAAALHARSSARLRSCPASEVARTVAAELQAAWEGMDADQHVQAPTGEFARLARAWEAWFAEAAADQIRVRERTRESFDLRGALSRRAAVVRELRASEPEADAAVQFLSETVIRTAALSYLDAKAPQLAGNATLLQDWWMGAYFDAMAEQHETNWLRFREDTVMQEAQRRGRGLSGGETIQFQGSLVATLHDMPPQVYAVLRHQARSAIHDWQTRPSQKTSDALAYAVARSNAAVSLGEDRKAMWTRIALTLLPAVVGTLTAGFFSNLLAGVGSAIATVVLGVPLVEFTELHATRKKKMRAHIHFPAVPR